MRRILVAVDGSEPSLRAAKMAAQLAARMDAQVTCAHVIAPMFYMTDAIYVPPQELIEAERRSARELLAKAVASVNGTCPRVDSLLLEGPPAESLVSAAEESSDVDMIVVGSRGRNTVARVLLGSVADRVVHLSKKPVLVVR